MEVTNNARAWFIRAWADWQEIEELNQQVVDAYQEGRYQEAILCVAN